MSYGLWTFQELFRMQSDLRNGPRDSLVVKLRHYSGSNLHVVRGQCRRYRSINADQLVWIMDKHIIPQKADLWHIYWFLTGRQCATIDPVHRRRDAGIKSYSADTCLCCSENGVSTEISSIVTLNINHCRG